MHAIRWVNYNGGKSYNWMKVKCDCYSFKTW